jgi:hypothetical protein
LGRLAIELGKIGLDRVDFKANVAQNKLGFDFFTALV